MKKLLLVDDDIDLVDLFARHLREKGYEVDMCYDGSEGVVKVKDNKYDMILLDVMMPKMNGLEFLGQLKDYLVGTPIIMLTNLSRDGLVDRAVSLGAVGFINKTEVDPGSLEEKIRGFLGE